MLGILGWFNQMSLRQLIIDHSRGDNLRMFWSLFYKRSGTNKKIQKDVLTFLCCRLAHRHGGYIGNGANIREIPSLPHGLHGVYISRFSSIGKGCRIYQNVTIGEIGHKAPQIGDNCLIGAGAVIIGDIKIGNNVKIGAGAVVCKDIPDNCTVVCQAPRIFRKNKENSN